MGVDRLLPVVDHEALWEREGCGSGGDGGMGGGGVKMMGGVVVSTSKYLG